MYKMLCLLILITSYLPWRSFRSTISTSKCKADLVATDLTSNSTLSLTTVPYNLLDIIFKVKQGCQKSTKSCLESSGFDSIPPIVLKNCVPEFTPILTPRFNIMRWGIISNVWKTTRLLKVMESIVNSKMMKYLDVNKLIYDGFYLKWSTAGHLALHQ